MARDPRSELDLGRNWPLILFGRQPPRQAELPVPKSLARRPSRPRPAPLRLLSQTVQFYLDMLPGRRAHRQTLAAQSPLTPDTLVEIVSRNATREDPTIPRPRAAAIVPSPAPADPPRRRRIAAPPPPAIADDGMWDADPVPLADPELQALVAPRWPAALVAVIVAALAGLAVALLVLSVRSGAPDASPAPPAAATAAAQSLQIEVHPPPAPAETAALHPALREDLTFAPESVERTEVKPAPAVAPRRVVRRHAPRPRVDADAADDILAATPRRAPRKRVNAADVDDILAAAAGE